MNQQLLPNPYQRIEDLERSLKVIATWARVDVEHKKDKIKRSLPPCLRAEDVVRLVEGVM